MKKTKFSDLNKLQESERVEFIGWCASRKIIGVLLERNQSEKIARYIRKITKQFPEVRHISTTDGPTTETSLVQFGPKTVH